MRTEEAPFRISPSRLARFYFHECERYLRFRTAGKEERAASGIPRVEPDRSLLTQRILESGLRWEEEILEKHLGDRAIVADGEPGQAIHERRHGPETTMALLGSAAPGQAIYQPTLSAPPGFYEAFGLDAGLVEFVDCHPDLLMIEGDEAGGRRVVVVDAKASDLMKLSHRIQVALYAVLLEHAIAEAGIELTVARTGAVWLYGQAEPECFDLSGIRPPLELFLSEELTPLLEAPAADAFWHLYFRCEWCDYFTHCRQEAESTQDVSLVPYLSTFAKRHLQTVANVRSLDDLTELLATDGGDAALVGCASIEGRGQRLRTALGALAAAEPLPTGAASAGMPVGEHIRVVLTVQSEPLTGSVYAFAINRLFGGDLYGGENRATVVDIAASSDPDELARLRASLVRSLLDVLKPVHDHNSATAEWREQKSLQAYVFDGYERDLLVQALLEEVAGGAEREGALALLFHFQHPDLAVADDHPAAEVFFPLIVLTDVVRRVLALPVHVAYRLADVNQVLQPSEFGFRYSHNDFHSFELSNRMKSNAIFEVWHRGRDDLLSNIANELRARVWAASSVIAGLRERLKDTGALFAWPPKFFLPPGLELHHDLLSRLVFITRYESTLGYLDVRVRRALPEAERALGDSSLIVVAQGDGSVALDPRQHQQDIDTGGFPNWVLTLDDDAGRRARLTFDDFPYRGKMYGPKNKPLALAAIDARPTTGTLRITLRPTAAFTMPVAGQRCTLDERFTDWNTGGLISEHIELDAVADPWFVRLLLDPVRTRATTDISPTEREASMVRAGSNGMTASQLAAFGTVLDHDLGLVWGPPGTGKTHFLAVSILCLLEAARLEDRPLRVLITGFTHNAIDNVLAKLRSLQESTPIVDGPFTCRKLMRDGAAPVSTLDPKDAAAFHADHDLLVFGATIWQARKLSTLANYDLVVIDEGSQLKVSEATVPISRLAPGGRLIVAGDDKQLPPIVKGSYPEVEGLPPLHRSILEALRHGDGESLVSPLLENFRMNDVLCRYPAATIYPEDYRPANPSVAARRLDLPGAPGSELLGLLLDPASPLTVVITEDVRATRENEFEAGLVASLVLDVRSRVDEPDIEFWKNRVFVVGPHHAQNRLVRRRLTEGRSWDHPPFVDTVDKMQGQECDLVIVSYGVSDVEYALGEKEFIYSLNRLNVAATRARSKTIVLLSRLLLEPPLQALDDDDVALGIAHMQGLARWCEVHGERLEVQHDGHRLTVLRS